MTSPPRSIPPGTSLHRDWNGRYHLTPTSAPSYPQSGGYTSMPPYYGMPAQPAPPSYYSAPTQPYIQAPQYSSIPAGHVLVPVTDLQHLIANQPQSNGVPSAPGHSVFSIHPNGSTHDVSHSHPHLHGSNAPIPQTTIGSPSPVQKWTQ